ncbi:hypothetical protein THOM_0657 [Trachipleistophora hominis]|uniref:Uncharacterized protein n=1 Tax=Trachipleistophora hominis TaxID=72359 RepID=L7JYF8_TRAHO|nr:hypothetical protein THOM_0657 [Trachipleistophora hominis]
MNKWNKNAEKSLINNKTRPYVLSLWNTSHSPRSYDHKSSKGTGAPRLIFFIIAAGIGSIFLVSFIFNWFIFGKLNRNFTKKMQTNEIKSIKRDFIPDNALSSFVLMNSCVVNGENCLSVFPLLNDVHLVLEKDTILGPEVDDRLYYRKNYFETMMTYYKEKSKLRYIPVSNVKTRSIFEMGWFTKTFRNTKKNRYSLLTAANNFVDTVLHKSTFCQPDETFLFAVLSRYYIDVIKYNFTGERFVFDRSFSFYFERGLASESFSYIVDALSKKLSGQQIDNLIQTIDNEDKKIKMCLNEIDNNLHINIPERVQGNTNS